MTRRPLRLAFIGQKGIPARWGGIEFHVEALSTRLAARGHAVDVFVRSWYTPKTTTEYRGVRLRHRPTIHTKHLDAVCHSLTCSLSVWRGGYDVVHYHAMGPSLFAWLARLRGRRVVTTVHGLDFAQRKWGRAARLALRLAERCAFWFSHRVIVVSRALEARYRAQNRMVTYLPNGIEPAEVPAGSEALDRLGLRPNGYLLFLSRWVPDKQVGELIAAYRSLPGPKPHLVVAGDADNLDAYRQQVLVAAAGDPQVVFPGYVEGAVKAQLLAHARAFVSASALEGLPIALLEAMTYGLPCLVSDIPAHREALDGGRLGVLFPADTSPQIAEGLRQFLAQPPEKQAELGQRARQHVLQCYDWERVVDGHEAVYGLLTSR